MLPQSQRWETCYSRDRAVDRQVQVVCGEERKIDPWYWVPGRSELSLALFQVEHGLLGGRWARVVPIASGATQADFRHIYPEGYRRLGTYQVPTLLLARQALERAGGLLLRQGAIAHRLSASRCRRRHQNRATGPLSFWRRPAFVGRGDGEVPSGRGTGVWPSSEKRNSGPQTPPRTSRLSVNSRAALASRPTPGPPCPPPALPPLFMPALPHPVPCDLVGWSAGAHGMGVLAAVLQPTAHGRER
jgi:hypothetical protein